MVSHRSGQDGRASQCGHWLQLASVTSSAVGRRKQIHRRRAGIHAGEGIHVSRSAHVHVATDRSTGGPAAPSLWCSSAIKLTADPIADRRAPTGWRPPVL